MVLGYSAFSSTPLFNLRNYDYHVIYRIITRHIIIGLKFANFENGKEYLLGWVVLSGEDKPILKKSNQDVM